MQLTIEVHLNNTEPCRVSYENGAVRKFNIEIPGTSKDQVNEVKLIQAAQGLASYEDVIPSLVNELNNMMNVPEEPETPTPLPPAGADDEDEDGAGADVAIDMSGEPRAVAIEIGTEQPDKTPDGTSSDDEGAYA